MMAKKVHKLVWEDVGYGNFHPVCGTNVRQNGHFTTEDSGVTCENCKRSMKKGKK